MQNIPLDSIDEITPEWLTRVLSDGGYLTRGTVSEIQNRSHKSNWASNAILRLSYSANALGEKPTKLFFKLCNPGPGTFGDSEIVYYSIVAAEINVAFAEAGLAPMLDEVGGDLPTEWLTLIYKIFATHCEKMIERVGDGKDMTCIHGDLNPGNILSPVTSMDKTYLIDRQPFDWSLTTWLGASDVANMMVHWWEPEMRKGWEKPLLENYHRHLLRLGIRDYTFDQLWDHYRLCAMQSLYVPATWCVDPVERKEEKGLWWSQLQKTMAACVDLKCAELLQ